MENSLYITIELDNMNNNIFLRGSSYNKQWEEVFALTDYHKIGIKVTDERIYSMEDIQKFSSAVGELFRSLLREIQITKNNTDNISVSINLMRMFNSEKEVLWRGNIAPYVNELNLDGYYIGQEVEDKFYSYMCKWQNFFFTKSEDVSSENQNNSDLNFSTNQHKFAFFFCYILPVIIVSVLLAPTIIGLIVFIVIMCRGKEEFLKGHKRCSDSNYTVDWEFTRYRYSSSKGSIQSGLEYLDMFLDIIKPLYNFIFREMWRLVDLVSELVLKILFSISCCIYRFVIQKKYE